MSCTDQVCGTGGWTGPLPGDPDNNVSLHANPTFGGIDVSWTYPTTNAHAVAHTLLYRSTSSNKETAIQIAVVAGNRYYDKIEEEVRYFYWIQLVSINGTTGGWIGPASAVSRTRKQGTLEDLTAEIDAGVLAQSLKKEIDKITLNYAELVAETESRIRGESILAAALAEVKIEVGQAVSFVNEEIITRRDGDSALASQITVIAAANTKNTAAIIEEKTARVTADGALTNMYATVLAKTDANTAAITNETTARTTADSALATQYTTLLAKTDSNAAAILDEKSARASADSALTTQYNAVLAATQNNAAALTVETTARTTADSALASQITTAQATLNGSISSVQTTMQTQINAVTGELDAIYTAKVDVNGMVGGFGIYGTPTLVEAGFDVDRFWVGRTNSNKVKPFIIDNDVVYINKARIRNADIDTLKIAGNAVTVPVGGAGNGGFPTFYLSMPEGGNIILIVAANYLAYEGSKASVGLWPVCNGVAGPMVSISLFEGYSGSSTAIASFPVGPGYHTVSGNWTLMNGVRNLGVTSVIALGAQR